MSASSTGNIATLLFTQGLARTLDYFCSVSVFSVLSAGSHPAQEAWCADD